jgi:hypothetical protein
MIKRILGWILFLWADACLYGQFHNSMGLDVASGPEFWTKLGTGLALGVLAVIGILLGLGVSFRTCRPAEPPATQK